MTTLSSNILQQQIARPKLRTPAARARGRFFRNRMAVAGAVVLTLLALICYGSLPFTLARQSSSQPLYADQHLPQMLEAPSAAHWMGTDAIGRDLLARFTVGGAVSLAIGIISAAIAVCIGTSIGLIAGYAGGRTDAALMRFVDVLYGLPTILIVILLRVALVPRLTLWFAAWQSHGQAVIPNPAMWANVLVLLVGIGGVSWLTMSRVVRGQVLSLRGQPFMEAARALGLGHRRILWRHLLPNIVGPILVYATLIVPEAILAESFLSFLGLGIQQPLPSWGNLASDGVAAINPIHTRWWLIVWPCVGLTLALLCLNFVGEGLRDALDPKTR